MNRFISKIRFLSVCLLVVSLTYACSKSQDLDGRSEGNQAARVKTLTDQWKADDLFTLENIDEYRRSDDIYMSVAPSLKKRVVLLTYEGIDVYIDAHKTNGLHDLNFSLASSGFEPLKPLGFDRWHEAAGTHDLHMFMRLVDDGLHVELACEIADEKSRHKILKLLRSMKFNLAVRIDKNVEDRPQHGRFKGTANR